MTDSSPLAEAKDVFRQDRQRLIHEYQTSFGCRLVVLIDQLFQHSVARFEETIHDADPKKDLHIILHTPGGSGETAVRLVHQAQRACKELTVIVPDQAKSAGTLLALGAHHILMGRTSDLGPVDPQIIMHDGRLASAKEIVAAVERAEKAVEEHPDTYAFHVAMLSDVSGVMVEQARNAINHSDSLLQRALECHPGRSRREASNLARKLSKPLIEEPQDHATTISAERARMIGIPSVKELAASCDQWNKIWHLWSRYVALLGSSSRTISIYESEHTSQTYVYDDEGT